MLYREDSSLGSLGAPSLSPPTQVSVHEPTAHLSPKSAACKGSVAPGPPKRPCRRGTQNQTRLDRCGVGGTNPPYPRAHCSGSLPNLAQEGEADTSGRHMSPGSRFGLMGCTGDARQTTQGTASLGGYFKVRGAAFRQRKEGTGSSLQSWMPLAGPRALEKRAGEGPRPRRTGGDPWPRDGGAIGPVEMRPEAKSRSPSP